MRGRVDLETMKRRIYRAPAPNVYNQSYFYVFGWTKGGKAVCWGPYSTQDEADSYLAELTEGEVFPLATRDIQRATREIKAILVERGGDPDEALRRMLHKRDD